MLGENGDDLFLAGTRDYLIGGDGNATFLVVEGGNNILSGGAGEDTFWIGNGQIPKEVNLIQDFDLEEDIIGIASIEGIASIDDLSFSQIGSDTAIDRCGSKIAILPGIDSYELRIKGMFSFK